MLQTLTRTRQTLPSMMEPDGYTWVVMGLSDVSLITHPLCVLIFFKMAQLVPKSPYRYTILQPPPPPPDIPFYKSRTQPKTIINQVPITALVPTRPHSQTFTITCIITECTILMMCWCLHIVLLIHCHLWHFILYKWVDKAVQV